MPQAVPHSVPPRRSFHLRQAACCLAVIGGSLLSVSAAAIPVGDSSFETPDIDFFSTYGQMPFLPWKVTETAPGQQVGLFDNTVTPGPFIDNASGGQVAFMLVGAGITLYQDLSDPAAVFTVGQSYQFTIAAGASTGTNSDSKLQVRLYYLVGQTKVTVNTFSANFNLSQNPNGITHLYDVSVSSGTVQASDAWAGKSIGIEIATPGTPNGNGSYWDLDNARLFSVPEPSSALLLGLGALAGGLRRRRRPGSR